MIVLSFTNINIDCAWGNNLRIDSGYESYTFCGNQTTNSFQFYTMKSNWIAIQKFGVVSFTCSFYYQEPHLFNPSKFKSIHTDTYALLAFLFILIYKPAENLRLHQLHHALSVEWLLNLIAGHGKCLLQMVIHYAVVH